MASEIRVDKINSLSGVGTVTLSPTGVDIAGITTAATLRATTGIVTSLTAGSLTSLGAVSGTTGTFTSTVNSGTTATGTIFSVGDSGNSGDRAIQFKRAATTNDINIQAINSGSGGTNLLFNQEGGAASFGGALSATSGTFTGGIDVTSNVTISDSIVHSGDTNTKIRFPEADTLTVETNGTERIRIQSNGNTGIGTITAQNNARLQVSTNQQVVAAFEGTGGSDPQIYIGDDMTTPTDNVLVIGYDKADNRGYLTVGGDADTVFQVKNGGDIEIGVGNLKFGTAGKGIDFSTTSDASGMTSELLDDYEEGNHTHTDASAAGLTFSYGNAGRYTKIGRFVIVSFDLQYPNTSDGNLAAISAPFSNGLNYGAGVVGWNELGRPLQIHISSGSVYLMDNNATGGNNKHLTNAECSGKRIIGNYTLQLNI